MIDKPLIHEMLRLFYQGAQGYLNIFNDQRSNFFFNLAQPRDKLVDSITFLNERGNIWFSPGLRRAPSPDAAK